MSPGRRQDLNVLIVFVLAFDKPFSDFVLLCRIRSLRSNVSALFDKIYLRKDGINHSFELNCINVKCLFSLSYVCACVHVCRQADFYSVRELWCVENRLKQDACVRSGLHVCVFKL